jgi:hypothetical protein
MLLEVEVASPIQGLPLTNPNYDVASDIMKEIFSKPQTIITAHMDDLLKLPSLSQICRVKDLRFVLDILTFQVRRLESLGVNAQHIQYGSLLTPIREVKISQFPQTGTCSVIY